MATDQTMLVSNQNGPSFPIMLAKRPGVDYI
jgi:hypothetical protein